MIPSSPSAAPCHIHFQFLFTGESLVESFPMTRTAPVAGEISNTESAHAGMPRTVPALVRIPRRYLNARSVRTSSVPSSVTEPREGSTRTTRRLWEGTP